MKKTNMKKEENEMEKEKLMHINHVLVKTSVCRTQACKSHTNDFLTAASCVDMGGSPLARPSCCCIMEVKLFRISFWYCKKDEEAGSGKLGVACGGSPE